MRQLHIAAKMFAADYSPETDYEEFRIELLSDASGKVFTLLASLPSGPVVTTDFSPAISQHEVELAFAEITRANTLNQFMRSTQLSTVDIMFSAKHVAARRRHSRSSSPSTQRWRSL